MFFINILLIRRSYWVLPKVIFYGIICLHRLFLFEICVEIDEFVAGKCMFSVWILEFSLLVFLSASARPKILHVFVRCPKCLHPNDSISCSAFLLCCGFGFFVSVVYGFGCCVGVMCVWVCELVFVFVCFPFGK